MPYKYWTKEELDFLVQNFENCSDDKLSSTLNRRKKQIQGKARQLKLYKSKIYMEKVLLESSNRISSGEFRHQFEKNDPDIFFATGKDHPRYIKDRSLISLNQSPSRLSRFSNKTKETIFNKQKGLCNNCSILINNNGEYDHIKPACVGGTNKVDNCQLLCFKCHLNKTLKELVISHNFTRLDLLQEEYQFIARNAV